jgi:hypothetical protein
MSSQIELSTQLACAFLQNAYTIRKEQPNMLSNKYRMDWLLITFKLFRLNAASDAIAPVQPTISTVCFCCSAICLIFNAKKHFFYGGNNAGFSLINA